MNSVESDTVNIYLESMLFQWAGDVPSQHGGVFDFIQSAREGGLFKGELDTNANCVSFRLHSYTPTHTQV